MCKNKLDKYNTISVHNVPKPKSVVDMNKDTELKDVRTIEKKSADDNMQCQPSSTEHNAPSNLVHMQVEVINNTDSDWHDEHNVPSSEEDNSSADSKSDVDCDICDDILNTGANSSYYVCTVCTDPSGAFCVRENCYKTDKKAWWPQNANGKT